MVHDIAIFTGNSHPELSAKICHNLSSKLGKAKFGKFSNGETSLSVDESVREKDVFVIQSGCGHVNDNFMELLIMLSACKTASAKRVTAVIPLFPYSRQPDVPYTKKGAPLVSKEVESGPNTPKAAPAKAGSYFETKSNRIPKVAEKSMSGDALINTGYKQWVAQSGTLIADLLVTAGADHIITMDLHDAQFQGFFDIPVDNLYSKPILQHYISTKIPNYQDAVIVSPDAGGAKRSTAIADALGMSFALIHKERRSYGKSSNPGSTASTPALPAAASATSGTVTNIGMDDEEKKKFATTMLVGDVKGKECILIDDLVDTSYTITRAAKLLKDQGATKVYAIITHAIFSGDAIKRVLKSSIDKIIVTNSVPQDEHLKQLGDALEVLDVSKILSEAIRRIHNGESVSMLFDHAWE